MKKKHHFSFMCRAFKHFFFIFQFLYFAFRFEFFMVTVHLLDCILFNPQQMLSSLAFFWGCCYSLFLFSFFFISFSVYVTFCIMLVVRIFILIFFVLSILFAQSIKTIRSLHKLQFSDHKYHHIVIFHC